MTIEDIKVYLIVYIDLILKCEQNLKTHYHIDGIPYANQEALPKTNEIQTADGLLKYNFHGSGCTIFLDKVELSYDVYLPSSDYLVTSPWKFLQFLNCYSNKDEKINEEFVTACFTQLEDEKILIRVIDGYWCFVISFKWHNNFKNRHNLELKLPR